MSCINKYSEYNFIPLGDNCMIPTILRELSLRKCSYPFDWVSKKEEVHDSNITYNVQIINELNSTDNIDDIIKKYFGNAFSNNKINSENNINFPHDGTNYSENFEKYKRRFIRLKQDLNKKNMFILLTRHYYIEKNKFDKIIEQLLSYNNDSIILFISGTDHQYFKDINNKNVIFKFIEYDISKYYEYDYSTFKPNVIKYLSELLL